MVGGYRAAEDEHRNMLTTFFRPALGRAHEAVVAAPKTRGFRDGLNVATVPVKTPLKAERASGRDTVLKGTA